MLGRMGKGGGRGAKAGVIGALDVGTTKVACFITKISGARDDGAAQLKVLGIGHCVSRGVRGGAVVDINSAEDSIRTAVEQAERMAGVTLKDAVIGVSCGQPQSRAINVEVSIAGHEVGEEDLRRAHTYGRDRAPVAEREVLHCLPGSYSIDRSRGIRNPLGMVGDALGVNMYAITASSGPIRNLEACVERCHLDIAGKASTAYASALATLVPDEMDLGATVVDMGGGTTSIAVFFDGGLVFTDVLPVGGNHVTSDIARGLSTTLAHAERIKTHYGSAITGPNDARETISVPQIGDEDPESEGKVPRSMLTAIVQPRIEETFELVRDRLIDCGLSSISGRRVVLTGGASLLSGTREIATRVLSKQVRLGRPTRLSGLAEATGGPAFSACAGLALWAAQAPAEMQNLRSNADMPLIAYGTTGGASQGFAGFKRWIKENF